MKKLIKFLFAKEPPKLEQCTPFEIDKNESNLLYGGFKEYKPPIYERETTRAYSFKPTDLLTDINQTK